MSTSPGYPDALAAWWPLISPLEEEAAHAASVAGRLRAALGPGAHRVLELGSGCGHATHHLVRAGFRLTAVEASEPMLARSRSLNPGVDHHAGDMRELALAARDFDAVVLHDAAEHLPGEAEALATLRGAAAHLRPGGVFLLGVIDTRQSFRGPELASAVHAEGEREAITLSRVSEAGDGTLAWELTLLTREAGRLAIIHVPERCALRSEAAWGRLVREAGLKPGVFEPDEEGLWLLARAPGGEGFSSSFVVLGS